jgi:putative AlgH/UPF0301 family transcriptional regulator
MIYDTLVLASSVLNSGIHDLWRYAVINLSNDSGDHTVGFMMNQQVLNFDATMIPRVYGIKSPMPSFKTVYCGGPVGTDKITIIHSTEYKNKDTSNINGYSSLTFNDKIFEDIHQGKGPKQWKIMLGYCAWLPGQLESEIKRSNSWMKADCDDLMWSNYKRKIKMWQKIVEKNSSEQANHFLESITH